jgi:restriction system protein
MSFFQVKNYAEEFRAALLGEKDLLPTPIMADEALASVSEDTEETTRDFILKTLAPRL